MRYMISDASKQVDVEAHVLRYWEEELDIKIPRNEMGHRYYTENDITLLKNVKQLKEQGFQLKAIKMVIDELDGNECGIEDVLNKSDEYNNRAILENDDNTSLQVKEETQTEIIKEDKLEQFNKIIGNIVSNALLENNKVLADMVGSNVSGNVIKQMDYLMRMREEHDEERFRRLDETIRIYQRNRSEAAYTKEFIEKDSKGIFKKKKKEKTKRRRI